MSTVSAAPLEKPFANPALRKLAVALAVAFAIGAPAAQSLFPFGLSAAQFASDGDETLRAAAYAFSIWGPIYAGLCAYAIYQARAAATPLLRAVAWPSVVAIAGCGAWILASAFDLKLATVTIIVAAAAGLALTLPQQAHLAQTGRERGFVVWPLALLAGWLTIASAINALTVLTAYGAIDAASAPLAAGLGVAAVTFAALWVVLRRGLVGYPLPIAWGLAAVYVAERAHRPLVALGAAGAATAILAAVLFVGLRAKPHHVS